MAISKETEGEIVRLFLVEKWKIGTIATQLKVHHTTVDRALSDHGVPRPEAVPRPSIADPYIPMIEQALERYPTVPASRLYQMMKERGYTGRSEGHVRRIVAKLRPNKSTEVEAYHRLRTLPGEQGQVDWGHFGKIVIGRAKRMLMAFVLVLSFSRYIFLRFFTNQTLPVFLRGHVEAFETLGVPRVLLYDNPKTIVLERDGRAIRFHPRLLDFAKHYRYEPRPVAVARGNQKGRVERAIRYVRESFWPARQWRDLDDLNAQAKAWCDTVAADRPWVEDKSITVRQAYEQEKSRLLSLPGDAYTTDEREEVVAGKTPYVRFDLNDYSIPHTHVRRTLTVRATSSQVRVLDGQEVIADHRRSYDKGQQIEDEAHVAALTAHKQAARLHRGQDRLRHAAPQSERLLVAAAERGENIGAVTAVLLRLLDQYGAQELEAGIREALDKDVPHPHAVRQCLERRRQQRDLPPPISVPLSNDPRIATLVVRPHDLSAYDNKEQHHDPKDA
jgi:transposase